MKKYLPYILVLVILVAGGILVFTGSRHKPRRLDERISFSPDEKIPYGTWVAYRNLSRLFPHSSISRNLQDPGSWDSLTTYHGGQALLIISPTFNAAEYEMKKLIRFAEAGNDVFVSTASLASSVTDVLNCSAINTDMAGAFGWVEQRRDSLTVSLREPYFSRTGNYQYPGRRLDGYFYNLDTTITSVLGSDSSGNPNFVHFRSGKGNMYFHLAPMTFTNYFLLRDSNLHYFADMLSVIPPTTRSVVWDEYFLQKKENADRNSSQSNWLSSLFVYPSLKWGILMALLTLLVYTLMEMRRKQRPIPVVRPPRNDSLDFVQTIGRLYYDKGDHHNLCRKMAAYFLEHVRNRYKLPTSTMDEGFVQALHFKSGISETDIRAIVFFIQEMEGGAGVGDHQLSFFHKKLEAFYAQSG